MQRPLSLPSVSYNSERRLRFLCWMTERWRTGNYRELMKNCEVYRQIAMSQLSEEELANE